MKPGEDEYVNETLVRTTTLSGRGEEIVALIKELEAEGATQISIQVTYPFAREMI
jgi:hypothetical protein